MAMQHSSGRKRRRPFRFSHEQIERILRDYQAGASASLIARQHSVHPNNIIKILMQHFIPIRGSRVVFMQEEKELICDRYLAGESATAIAKRLSVHCVSIYRTLKEMGVVIRSQSAAQRKYPLKESVFDDAENDEEAAYFVGLLMADGSVPRRSARSEACLRLCLTWTDRDIIIRLQHFLQTNKPFTKENAHGYEGTKPSCRFEVFSRRLVEAVARYGVVPNKSGREAVSRLENNKHFWRGMIDGDGWLCLTCGRHPIIGLTGSLRIVEQFSDFAWSVVGKREKKPERNGSIWKMVIGYKAGYRLIQHLYGDCRIALARKESKAKEILVSCSPFCRSI